MTQSKKQSKKPKVIKAFTIPPKDTPISRDNPIPPYEDSGVRYQGYYKKQVNYNQYEIRKQYPAKPIQSSHANTGSEARLTEITPNLDYFITSISIHFTTDQTSGAYIQILHPNGTLLFIHELQAQNSEYIEFNAPIKVIPDFAVLPQYLVFVYGSLGGAGAGRTVSLILNGFLEEK